MREINPVGSCETIARQLKHDQNAPDRKLGRYGSRRPVRMEFVGPRRFSRIPMYNQRAMKTTIPASIVISTFLVLANSMDAAPGEIPNAPGLTIAWANDFLTIRGAFPGREIKIHYLEAYCRPGSTDRDWNETVISHSTVVINSSADHRNLTLRDRLSDGVRVDHRIAAHRDEIEFLLTAYNPTAKKSDVHWAQPCIRVDRFTGCTPQDVSAPIPEYARKCFVFLDGRLVRLPTRPWAEKARYMPGQVYCPLHVARSDVNPRPLSRLVPSNGLVGCFSGDERKIMAVAWQPYQELFLGVATCIHSDFRIGGLEPGETKKIRGKIYVVDANVPALVMRYEHDFPEQARTQ